MGFLPYGSNFTHFRKHLQDPGVVKQVAFRRRLGLLPSERCWLQNLMLPKHRKSPYPRESHKEKMQT